MSILDRFVVVFGTETSQATAGLRGLDARLDSTRARMNTMAAGMAKVGGVLTTVGGLALKSYAGVEKGFAKIEGLVGVSRDTLQGWSDDVHKISVDTATDQQALADALFFVTSAGFHDDSAIDILERTAKASAAGLGDQAAIANVATSAINAYGAENLSAAQAVDALVETVKLGQLAPEELASSLGKALAVAAAAGVEFGELGGFIAGLSKQGITAAEGVTQFRAILNALNRPSAEAIKMVEEVGLSFEQLRTIVADQGILAGLELLESKVGTEAINRIFPQEAIVGVQAMLGNAKNDFKQIFAEMKDSAGLTDNAFDIMAETVDFKFRRIVVQAKNAIIEIGEILVPTAEKFMGFAQAMINWYEGLGDGWKKALGTVLSVGPVLLGLAGVLKLLAVALGVLKPLLFLSSTMMAAFGTTSAGTAVGVAALTAKTWLLSAAFMGIPVIGWIAALVAAGVALYVFRDQIADVVQAVWDWFTGIGDALRNIGDAFGDWVRSIDAKIVELIDGALDAGKNFINAFWEGIQNEARKILNRIGDVFQEVRDLLPFSDAKKGPFSDLTESGRRFTSTFAAGIISGGHTLEGAVTNVLPGLTTPLPVGPVPVNTNGGGVELTLNISMDISVGDSDNIEEIGPRVRQTVEQAAREMYDNWDSNVRA